MQAERQPGTLTQPEPLESGPLGALAVDIYRLNAFRVTGLPVDVSARALNQHLERLRMSEKLGAPTVLAGGPFPLESAPDSETLRDAIQKLRNPNHRLLQEIFWFWPSKRAESGNRAALKALEGNDIKAAVDLWRGLEQEGTDRAVATHNLAILFHHRAIALEVEGSTGDSEVGESYWRAALKRWKWLLDQGAFWDLVWERARQIDDPRLGPDTMIGLRETLPLTVLSPGAHLAALAAERGDLVATLRLTNTLRAAGFEGDTVDRCLVGAGQPVRHRLKALCDAATSEIDASPQCQLRA